MLFLLLPQQNLADELVEELVADVEVRPDDHAGDDHDDRALNHLVLARPLDLAELADRLGDEALRAGHRQLAAAALAGRGLQRGTNGRLAAAVAHRALARLTTRAPLRPRLARHQRVSLCGVCWPHQRQNFLNSTRSGVLRFDFIDS